MKKKIFVIVGGGIIGMIASLLVKTKKNKVYLIEQNRELGGLFRSRKLYKNLFFDYGSHFLKQTGITKLDKLIFGNINSGKWNILGNLKGASFFRGELNDNSPFLNTNLLPKKIYNSGISQIFKKKRKKILNLEDQIKFNFGNIFLEKIFKPIIQKSFNSKLKFLNIDVHNFFGLGKIMAFDPEKSRQLKKNNKYDKIFSFHNSNEGQSKNKSLYAKKGGSGYLVDTLLKKVKFNKIVILNNKKISRISCEKKKINFILLNDKKKIYTDRVIWTLNHNILFKHLGYNIKKIKNNYFFVTLHHFVFNKKFLINSEYLQCYDNKLKTYRITLYPNINRNGKLHLNRVKKNNFFHLTAEVVSRKKENIDILQKIALKEIFKMKIISNKTNAIYKKSELLGNGIPEPTVQNFKFNKKGISSIKKKIKNITFSNEYKTGNSTGQLLSNIYANLKNEK